MSGKSHGNNSYDHGRTSGRSHQDVDRTMSRLQIEDRDHTRGSSQALAKTSGGNRSISQTLAKTSRGLSSSRALEGGNYGRDEYKRQSPDPSPDRGGASRPSKSGTSGRLDGRYKDEPKSSMASRSSSTRYGNTQMAHGGHGMANSKRLGGIDEEDEYDSRTAMVRSGGRSQAITTSGGPSMGPSRRKDDRGDDDTDSDQEVIAKKRFSKLNGQHLKTNFPALGNLLEETLQIKPEKLDQYCEDHFIRLDVTKNRVDISKLLKNVSCSDRKKCENAIKKYNTHQENERHLNGGKPAQSIFEPVNEDGGPARDGRSAGNGTSAGDGRLANEAGPGHRPLVTHTHTQVVHHTPVIHRTPVYYEDPIIVRRPQYRLRDNPYENIDSIKPSYYTERNKYCQNCYAEGCYCGVCDLTDWNTTDRR